MVENWSHCPRRQAPFNPWQPDNGQSFLVTLIQILSKVLSLHPLRCIKTFIPPCTDLMFLLPGCFTQSRFLLTLPNAQFSTWFDSTNLFTHILIWAAFTKLSLCARPILDTEHRKMNKTSSLTWGTHQLVRNPWDKHTTAWGLPPTCCLFLHVTLYRHTHLLINYLWWLSG